MAKREKHQAVPVELLSKEFLSRFKTEQDVSLFLKELHSQVLEQMLQGELDSHLGYEKHSQNGNNTGNSRNGTFPKKIQTEHGQSIIQIPRDRNSDFAPIMVPKHESRGLSIEKLVISLYTKGMSVLDIEDERHCPRFCINRKLLVSLLYLNFLFHRLALYSMQR